MNKLPSIDIQQVKDSTFFIHKIFETNSDGHYTERALLYQNILEYFKITFKKIGEKVVERLVLHKRIEQKTEEFQLQIDPQSFRIRELARWLMENNKRFLNYYTDSKSNTTMNSRIANNDRLIKGCINDLESSMLLEKIGTVEATKNGIPTPVYRLTDNSVIILLLMKYKDAGQKDRLKIQQIIFYLLQRYFSDYDSYVCDFIALLYAKALEKGLANSMITLLLRVMQDSNYNARTLVNVLNIVLRTRLIDSQTKNYFVDIWIETINQLEGKTRKAVMHHLKADIEYQIHLFQPPKDWEEMWIKNIQDCSKFVLWGVCDNCSQEYPVLVDFYVFQKNASPRMNCDKCNGKDRLQAYTTIPQKNKNIAKH